MAEHTITTATGAWLVETTHPITCPQCCVAGDSAVSLARAMGSTGATYTDGQHVARATREAPVVVGLGLADDDEVAECPRCGLEHRAPAGRDPLKRGCGGCGWGTDDETPEVG